MKSTAAGLLIAVSPIVGVALATSLGTSLGIKVTDPISYLVFLVVMVLTIGGAFAAATALDS